MHILHLTVAEHPFMSIDAILLAQVYEMSCFSKSLIDYYDNAVNYDHFIWPEMKGIFASDETQRQFDDLNSIHPGRKYHVAQMKKFNRRITYDVELRVIPPTQYIRLFDSPTEYREYFGMQEKQSKDAVVVTIL
ncbi:unnamed protein product [Ambrosiozyma monospora]|uniref:Unnamed protein product n=1 Tax=Ambrosiozyma monospora TaxID=43982 RepID=A0ACB5SRM1_AMBMO|nr:unnamed protein product [Ambrosiozyma monospora]